MLPIHSHISRKINHLFISITTEPFYTKLNAFLQDYYKYVETTNNIPKEKYKLLPYVFDTDIESELKFRRKSFEVVKKILEGRAGLKVLEIAPWNSWLTHLLAENENNVTCLDYFTDDTNGIATKKFYPDAKWTSLQCDIEDPYIFNTTFDLIVFNHCCQFLSKPHEVLENYKKFLSPGGTIILIGLSIYKYEKIKKREVAGLIAYYKEKFNIQVFLNPCRGYLNTRDKVTLETNSFKFYNYKMSVFKKVVSLILFIKPAYCFAVYRNP